MAKNQSQRPGRDVRGGTGKRQRKGSPQAQGHAQGRKRGQQRPYGRTQPARKHKPAGGRSHGSKASLIEGRRACAEALDARIPLRRALVAASAGERDRALDELVTRLERAGVPVEYVPRDRLDGRSSHGAHQGIMLEVEPFAYVELVDVIAAAGEGDALVLLLDHVTDEGNFGAIVRSAEVVGAAGVVIASARAAQVGTAAYKTSAGAVLHLPIARVPNLATAVEQLKEAGFWVGAATEHAHDDVWHAPLEGRVCLVMGSEDSGVSSLVRKRCDFECKLPQRGRVESLNVAQAATALCYEWLRREFASASADVSGDEQVSERAAAAGPAYATDSVDDFDSSYATDIADSLDFIDSDDDADLGWSLSSFATATSTEGFSQ